MCEARSGETRQFTNEIIRVVPKMRRWEAVYCMFDPARTVKKDTSAHTGKAVWSWIGNELKIWEASGHFWRPDEIVKDIFLTNEKYNPVVIGIEETGLNEFVMQPIRQEMSKRGDGLLPIRPMNAPKGKLDFIRGLQPFFMSGEATMAQECPDLRQQLLNFPVGRIDVPNALAYALKMRPGLPVFEDFCESHIVIGYQQTRNKKAMAVNYEGGVVTGVVFERGANGIIVLADVILEGDPQQRAKDILEVGYYIAGGANKLDVMIHPMHYEKYSASGLVGAIKKEGCEPRRSGDLIKGRGFIVDSLRERRNGKPTFRVAIESKYVLNAMSGGYAFEYKKAGKGLSDRANEGMYRTLMEGFECAMAVYTSSSIDDDSEKLNYRTDRS